MKDLEEGGAKDTLKRHNMMTYLVADGCTSLCLSCEVGSMLSIVIRAGLLRFEQSGK